MRLLMLLGVVLILFGICALVFQGFTFFTHEPVVDAGPFHVDVQKPHTIIFHPLVGVASVGAGVVLVVVGSRRPAP
jgi:hypothetical protein